MITKPRGVDPYLVNDSKTNNAQQNENKRKFTTLWSKRGKRQQTILESRLAQSLDELELNRHEYMLICILSTNAAFNKSFI